MRCTEKLRDFVSGKLLPYQAGVAPEYLIQKGGVVAVLKKLTVTSMVACSMGLLGCLGETEESRVDMIARAVAGVPVDTVPAENVSFEEVKRLLPEATAALEFANKLSKTSAGVSEAISWIEGGFDDYFASLPAGKLAVHPKTVSAIFKVLAAKNKMEHFMATCSQLQQVLPGSTGAHAEVQSIFFSECPAGHD